MGWLFGRSKHAKANAGEAPKRECRHLNLAPRWDSAQDMGKPDLATAFICDSCHLQFTPEEAREIIAGRS